jgi:hypothetical protein
MAESATLSSATAQLALEVRKEISTDAEAVRSDRAGVKADREAAGIAAAAAEAVRVAVADQLAAITAQVAALANISAAWNWPPRTWTVGEAFEARDLVTHSGSLWGALQTSSGATPGSDLSIWVLLAGRGDAGPAVQLRANGTRLEWRSDGATAWSVLFDAGGIEAAMTNRIEGLAVAAGREASTAVEERIRIEEVAGGVEQSRIAAANASAASALSGEAAAGHADAAADILASVGIAATSGWVRRSTRVLLGSVTPTEDLTPGEVTNDPNPALNGTYRWIASAVGADKWAIDPATPSLPGLAGRTTTVEGRVDEVEAAIAASRPFHLLVDGLASPRIYDVDPEGLLITEVTAAGTAVGGEQPFQLLVEGIGTPRIYDVDHTGRLIADMAVALPSEAPFQLLVDGLDGPHLFDIDIYGRLIAEIAVGAQAPIDDAAALYVQDEVSGAQINRCFIPVFAAAVQRKPVLSLWAQLGQSLAIGGVGGSLIKLLSTTPVGLNLTTPEGPWPMDDREWSELSPAVEKLHRLGAYAETGAVAMINRLAARIHDAFGEWPLLATLVSGAGGTAIANLDRGSWVWSNHLEDVRKAKAYADAQGWDFCYAACHLIHGNTDGGITSEAQYLEYLLRFQRTLEEDILRINPRQTERVIVYVTQADFCRTLPFQPFGVVMAQARIQQASCGLIRMIGNNQDIPRQDGTHPYNAGYYHMGQRAGDRIFIDYCLAPKPAFVPQKVWRSGALSWDLEYEPWVGDLVLDISNDVIATAGLDFGRPSNGRGFEVDDGTASPPYVAAVEILPTTLYPALGYRRVRLTLSAAPAGYRLTGYYATRAQAGGESTGPTTGGRGCLRDSAAWISDRDIAGDAGSTPFTARNWASRCSFDMPL